MKLIPGKLYTKIINEYPVVYLFDEEDRMFVLKENIGIIFLAQYSQDIYNLAYRYKFLIQTKVCHCKCTPHWISTHFRELI